MQKSFSLRNSLSEIRLPSPGGSAGKDQPAVRDRQADFTGDGAAAAARYDLHADQIVQNSRSEACGIGIDQEKQRFLRPLP